MSKSFSKSRPSHQIPLLKLEVGYHDPPDAREVGRIIERLGNAYGQQGRMAGVARARLALEEIQISSLFAFFRSIVDLADATLDIAEHRLFLNELLSNIASAFMVLKDASNAHIPPAFRTLLEVIAAPVAKGRASHASISIHGDNTNVFYIENLDAIMIETALAERLRVEGIHRLPMPDRDFGAPEHRYVDGSHARQLGEDGPIVGTAAEVYRTLRDSLEPPKALNFARAIAASSQTPRAAPKRLLSKGLFGTLLHLGGRWYVRPEGYFGALFPLDESAFDVRNLSAEHEYLVTGRVQDSQYRIDSLQTPRS